MHTHREIRNVGQYKKTGGGVIRSRKWKKQRQFYIQKKKDKKTNNDLQNTAEKTKP